MRVLVASALAGLASAAVVPGGSAVVDGIVTTRYYSKEKTVFLNGATPATPFSGTGGECSSIMNSKAEDMTEKVIGYGYNPIGTQYLLDFKDLPDDTYSFTCNSGNFALVVDTTKPVGTPKAATAVTYIGDSFVAVNLPTDLFTDNISNTPGKLTVKSVKPLDADTGFRETAVNQLLSAASVTAVDLFGPESKASRYEVTVADEAGNTATTVFSIPVVEKPNPVITLMKKGLKTSTVANTAFTAEDRKVYYAVPAAAEDVELSGQVAFQDKMMITGTVSDLNGIIEGSLATAAIASGTGYGVTIDTSSLTVTAVTASTNKYEGRVFKFTVKVKSADIPVGTYHLTIGNGALTRVSDSALSAAAVTAVTLDVKVAKIAPTAMTAVQTMVMKENAVGTTVPLHAKVGDAFFWYFPASFANEFTRAAGDISIVGFDSKQLGAGLRVVNGKIGRAYIAGTVGQAPQPTNDDDYPGYTGTYAATGSSKVSQIVLFVTVRDEAGNEATTPVAVKVVSSTITAKLVLAGGAITATEGATGVKVTDASNMFTGAVDKVHVFLETPDDSTVSAALKEKLDDGAATYQFDTTYKFGQIITTKTIFEGTGVWYKNEYEDAQSSDNTNKLRSIRIVGYEIENDGNGGTAAYIAHGTGVRSLTYTVENDPPVVTVDAASAWDESVPADFTAKKVQLFPAPTITDDDDDSMRGATVAIKSDECYTYDSLALEFASGNYNAYLVTGTYNAATCTLTITPVARGNYRSVTKAEMVDVLMNVYWKTSNAENPNFMKPTFNSVGNKIRSLIVTVTDDGSNGHAAPKSNTVAANSVLTVTADYTPVKVDKVALYGPGGLAYNPERNANIKLEYDAILKKNIVIRKFSIVRPKSISLPDIPAVVPSTKYLTFNFNKVKDQYYGNNALFFADVADRDSAINAPGSVALPNTPPSDVTFEAFTGGALNVLEAAAGTSPALWAVNLKVSSDTAAGAESKIALEYDGATIDVYVDLLEPSCPFDSANAFAPIASTKAADADSCTVSAFAKTIDPAALPALPTFALGVPNTRGYVKFNLAAGAFSALDTLDISVYPAKSKSIKRMPEAPKGAVFVNDLIYKFAPAGLVFTTPQAVTINVGAAITGYKYALLICSQVDPADESKGYKDCESLPEQSYDKNSGLINAKIPHFSLVATVLVPAPEAETQSKVFPMGASCPNDCSGKGYCRENGQCLCFDGFTGYDCSLRTCPADQSWDLPLEPLNLNATVKASAIVHQIAECSSRGACDRKTGECVCEPGFEGSACQRVACPNDCSGHGKCRLISSNDKWEDNRIQQCYCDGGYQGPDCSQRICPFGDDPETVCHNDKRQVQTVSLDFGSLPSAASGSLSTADIYNTDELTLGFTTKDNTVFWTGRIADVYERDATAVSNIKSSLTSLPNFAVSDVQVSARDWVSDAKVEYDVTFKGNSLEQAMIGQLSFLMSSNTVAGNTVSGNQNFLKCYTDSNNYALGCNHEGCRPKVTQPRVMIVEGDADIMVNANSVLRHYDLSSTATWATPGVWGIEATVTVNFDGTYATYSIAYAAYGASLNCDDVMMRDTDVKCAEQPVPPMELRKNVPVGFGLHIDFPDTFATGQTSTEIKYRLAKCTVTQADAANADYEVYECSNRGVCDRKSGTCTCFQGYNGYNCGQQTIVV